MNAAYVAEVERVFLRCAGRGIMLSPRDLDLVERWERAGLPLDVVVRAIEGAFDRRPEGSRAVRSLSYVTRAVDEAARDWRTRQVGGERAREAGQGLEPAFERLVAALDAAAAEGVVPAACDEARRAVRRIADAALTGREADPAAVLASVADDLADRALAALDPAERATLEAEVDGVLAAASGFDDAEALAEARQVRLRRAVREVLGLPALTLDLGGGRW